MLVDEHVLLEKLNGLELENGKLSVDDLEELSDCQALCAVTEKILLTHGLVSRQDLVEIHMYNHSYKYQTSANSSAEKLRLFLNVLESELTGSPFEEFEEHATTVSHIGNKDKETIVELCTFLLSQLGLLAVEEESEPAGEGEEEIQISDTSDAESIEGNQASALPSSPQRYVLGEVSQVSSSGNALSVKQISIVDDILGGKENNHTFSPGGQKNSSSPLKISLKLTNITEDPDLSLAMYPIENGAQRLKFLLDETTVHSPSTSAVREREREGSEEKGFGDGHDVSLALFPWKYLNYMGRNRQTTGVLEHHESEIALHDLSPHLEDQENSKSSRALHRHLISWMKRMDILKSTFDYDESDNIFSTRFRDGGLLCRIIQQIVGKRILGGITTPSSDNSQKWRFEAVSNINRGFQCLWSWMANSDLSESIKRDFQFYPESIVKGNERDLWQCLHFLYKVHLQSKGTNSSIQKQASTLSNIHPPQNMVTFQSYIDKILVGNIEDMKYSTSIWLQSMPIIGYGNGLTNKCQEKDLLRPSVCGSILCQLLTLFSGTCLYSAPMLDPVKYNEVFVRDNICIGLMALEQILSERMGKSQFCKIVNNVVADKFAEGDQVSIWKTITIIRFLFEWRDGTFKTSLLAHPVHNQTGSHANDVSSGKEGRMKRIMKWLVNLEVVEKDKSFSFVLNRLKAGTLFAQLYKKISKKEVAGIDEHPKTKEAREANIKRTCKHLLRTSKELSKYVSSAQQHKLAAGNKQLWLDFLEAMLHRHQLNQTSKSSTRQRAATYTSLGQRIKPESAAIEDDDPSTEINERTYRRLVEWIKLSIYIEKNVSLGQAFRDGIKLARLIQVVSKKQIRGINWVPSSHSSILQNLESVLKFLREFSQIDTIQFNVHKLASGDDATVTSLLWQIKEWHRQLQQKRTTKL